MKTYRYLLSTGETTSKVEYYILDLFRIYLTVLPGDVPNAGSNIGFDFSLLGVTKNNLKSAIRSKVDELVKKIKSKNSGIDIEVTALNLIDEETASIEVTVNNMISDTFNINIFE